MTDPVSGPLCIDLGATLVTAHSDKESAAATYEGGWGFHPLLAYLDRGDGTGEALAGLLRPGNAAASTAVDHIDVFESALARLPGLPEDTRVLVRADSGGAAKDFLAWLRDAKIGFSVSVRLTEPIKAAVRTLHRHARVWTEAVTQDEQVRDRAHVAEATGMVDLDDYPEHTWLIVRREPLHPGAQQTFDDHDGHRFTAFLTDQNEANLALLAARHGTHARRRAGHPRRQNHRPWQPASHDFVINTIWLQLILAAQDLLAFFAALALDGDSTSPDASPEPADGPPCTWLAQAIGL